MQLVRVGEVEDKQVVQEIFRNTTKQDLVNKFHPSFVATLIEVDDSVNVHLNWIFDGINFSAPQRIVTADMVRDEAKRRMILLTNARDNLHLDVIISNATREGVALLAKGKENWTAEDVARAAYLQQMNTAIDYIRSKSNAMENNPPDDFREDHRWQ